MTVVRAAAITAVLLLSSGTAAAQPLAQDPRVSDALELARVWLEAQRAYEQVPGVSAAIVSDQDVLWKGGFGAADLASGRPMTADTLCSICSISKLFTSIAVLQQRDAGRLRLDDPVKKHLPWFSIEPGGKHGADITIEGLLTHAAGLPREADYPYWAPPFTFPSHDKIVEGLSRQRALYPPETYFQYSNLGLTLAGEVVAATSGTPFNDYLSASILKPLGLTSTTTMPENERGKRLATGYSALTRLGRREPQPFFTANGIAPAAGLASDVGDLARFASWQFRLLESGGTEVLKASTLREMHRVHFTDPDFETTWGLGFGVFRSGGKTFVGHGGECPGYRSQLLLMPAQKIAVTFMANALGLPARTWALRLYEIVAPSILAARKEPGKGKAADPELSRYIGAYSGAPWGGETAIVTWEGSLALLELPTMDPMKDLEKLKKTAEGVFRVERKDETLGETVVFRTGPDGRATSFERHNVPSPRVR